MKAESKIRIAHIQGNSLIGGSQIHTKMLMENLPKDSYEHYLVAPEIGVFKDVIESKNIQYLLLSMSSKYNIGTSMRIARWCRENRIDIIHTHLRNADLHGQLAAFFSRTPVKLLTLHDIPNTDFTGIKTINNFSGMIYKRIMSLIPTRIITISRYIKNETIKIEPALDNKIITIYNGTDIELFNDIFIEHSKKSLSRKLTIGYVGRFTPRKNPSVYVRIMKELLDNKMDVRGVMFGDGPLMSDVRNMINDLKISEEIRLMGNVSEVKDIYRDMDILLFPAEKEPFGRVITEAMSAGVLVVAADSGAIPEIITHNKDGILFANVALGVSELLSVIHNTDKWKMITRDAREKSVRNFSAGVFTQNTSNLYKSLIQGLRAPTPESGR